MSSSKPDSTPDPTQASPSALLLALASEEGHVALGPVGVAARVSDACRAYQELQAAKDQLAELEPALLELVRTGSPAAIIYAALLLRTLGRRDLDQLLAPYADDRRPCVVWPGGCGGVSHWLCEATRWVLGEGWSHPERLLAYELDALSKATWLELPSASVVAAAREGRRRDGTAARGRWTFTFAELFFRLRPPTLTALVALVAPLVNHPSQVVRLYGASLLGQLDGPAGEAALRNLAASPETVPCLVRRWFGLTSVRAVLMQDAVTLVEAWLARHRPRHREIASG